jgi:hypothetical protein
MVVMPFALTDSNLPLEVAFPVLMANVVQVLAGPGRETPLVAGADRILPIPVGVGGTLHSPSGQIVQVDGDRPTATLNRIGVWDLRVASTTLSLAVNPDVSESDLAVRELVIPTLVDPTVAGDQDGAADTSPLGSQVALTTEGRVELSPWFLAVALLALTVELLASLWNRQRRTVGSERGITA